MTVLEKAPELDIRSNYQARLTVSASDITFHDLTDDTVEIRVAVRNEGEHPSNPTFMRLESAPLGAFVPWRPLAVLPLPPMQAGESREFSFQASRSLPSPMGDFDRIPPVSVLTALNAPADEPPAQSGAGMAGLLRLFRRQGSSRPSARNTTANAPFLAPDLWQFVGRKQVHWAGNINVFVGTQAVERHFANALRIYSGRTNLAMFIVGERSKSDAYAFEIVGLAPDWEGALYNATGARTLIAGSSDTPLKERQWVEANAGHMMVVLAVRPPVVCEEGNVQVHVTRRSCETTAVVEFNLDPTAQGPGCYVA